VQIGQLQHRYRGFGFESYIKLKFPVKSFLNHDHTVVQCHNRRINIIFTRNVFINCWTYFIMDFVGKCTLTRWEKTTLMARSCCPARGQYMEPATLRWGTLVSVKVTFQTSGIPCRLRTIINLPDTKVASLQYWVSCPLDHACPGCGLSLYCLLFLLYFYYTSSHGCSC